MAWVAVNKMKDEVIFNNKPIRHRYGYWKSDLDNESEVYLPEGTIKKLIGRNLTWDDESIELK